MKRRILSLLVSVSMLVIILIPVDVELDSTVQVNDVIIQPFGHGTGAY